MNAYFRSIRGGAAAALIALAAPLFTVGCGNNEEVLTDAEREKQAVLAVKEQIQGKLDELYAAAEALQAAAPAPDADGWNADDDDAALEEMKAQWKKARVAYESIEGAIAVVFPELDVSLDARYDAFIEVAPDDDLFDDQGVTGMHAVERILWSDSVPPSVVEFESGLAGYVAPAFPANEKEADAFKNKLCGRLVSDAKSMRDQFEGLALDAPSAFRGVIGSMMEQVEKVNKAATGEEESRYAQFTLADMKANVAAGIVTYKAFQSWVLTKDRGPHVDEELLAAIDRLQTGYDQFPGDALPPVPEGWSSENPTPEQLKTPFGQIFQLARAEADPDVDGSVVHSMEEAAEILGLAELN